MRKLFISVMIMIAMTFTIYGQALALNPDEVLQDKQLENRARELSTQIRCLVCQNQSIDDSDAKLAKDLRLIVREQLVAGKSDEEILDFLVERYGEFVLLKPQFTAQNFMLWSLPFVALVGGGLLVFGMFNRRKAAQTQSIQKPLTKKEKAELSKILNQD